VLDTPASHAANSGNRHWFLEPGQPKRIALPSATPNTGSSGDALTQEQLQALEMLADSSRGVTEAVLATRGLAGDLLAGLVRDELAAVAGETVWDNERPIEVVRVQITDSGRRALKR